jgi:endonuclease YncB( thermonuclease family)
MNRITLLIGACCALAACSPASPATTSPPSVATPSASSAPASERSATAGAADLVQVIDGDTIEVSVDGGVEVVRLIGINAPESNECHGPDSRTALEALLASAEITLEQGTPDDRDRFGRLLRYVAAGEIDVNARQLETGDAIVLQTTHDRRDEYVAAAEAAAGAGVGLWRRDRCGPPPGENIEIAAFDPNPPGPDDDPATGEFVVIAHVGDEPWDLTGWSLRDESSIHRFEFPDIGILPTEEYTVRTACGTERDYILFWCAGGPVWSNSGDTIILMDPHGNIVDHLIYQG